MKENRDDGNHELVKLMDYLQKFNIPFFYYKFLDAVALSKDNLLKLLALLRLEGY